MRRAGDRTGPRRTRSRCVLLRVALLLGGAAVVDRPPRGGPPPPPRRGGRGAPPRAPGPPGRGWPRPPPDDLHGEHVLAEDHVRHGLGVRRLVGRREPLGGAVRRPADDARQDDAQAEPGEQPDPALAADGLHEGVGAVDADEHEDEQEEHHHGAGVDDHLHDAEELGPLRDVQERQRDHDEDDGQGRVDGLAGQQQAERREHHERAERPEQHGLGRARPAGLGQCPGGCRQHGEDEAHRAPPWRCAAAVIARCARRVVPRSGTSARCAAFSGSVGSSGRCSATHATWSSVTPVTSPR